jgi:hypothetical protein
MAAQPMWTTWTKALWFACWNANSVYGRKQELDHILGQHGSNIRLLTETHLRSGEVFWMANYVTTTTG